MNKTKQEMLELIDELNDIAHSSKDRMDKVFQVSKCCKRLRTLITDSVILSDGEIEELRHVDAGINDAHRTIDRGYNAALDKIKDMK